MARPERIRKVQFCLVRLEIPCWSFLNNTIAHAKSKMMTVLIAVARLESIPLIPNLAKTAVRAAKKADSKA